MADVSINLWNSFFLDLLLLVTFALEIVKSVTKQESTGEFYWIFQTSKVIPKYCKYPRFRSEIDRKRKEEHLIIKNSFAFKKY